MKEVRMTGRLGDFLRTGRYMTRERALVGTGIFGFWCAVAFFAVILTSDGLKDFKGRPLGTDFIVFYAGGEVAHSKGAAAVYDMDEILAAHQAILNETSPDWGPFLYPPAFIFIAATLASLPYAAAWLSWMALTGAGYAIAVRTIAGFSLSLVPILSFSAVFMNVMQGQTGFLIAGLFGGALAALFSARSILAGVLFGLIALKPQFGVLIPIALLAIGDWRAFLAAAATVLLVVLAPTFAFGAEIWPAYANSARAARIILEKGDMAHYVLISVFTQARVFGVPLAAAYALQAATALAAAVVVFRVWRSEASNALKGAILLLGTLIASPHVVEYDLLLLAPAIAFLVTEAMKTGFRDYEKTLLVLAFLTPALTRPVATYAAISLGLVIILLLLAVVLARLTPGGGALKADA